MDSLLETIVGLFNYYTLLQSPNYENWRVNTWFMDLKLIQD